MRQVSRVTILASDIPYPAVHGGRVDIWRRMRFLAAKGVELQYVCWSNETMDAEALRAVHACCEAFIRYPLPETVGARLRQSISLTRYPLTPITYRTAQRFEALRDAVEGFEPDVLWLDGYPAGILAMKLARETHTPLLYRSHNIEHLYQKRLRASDAATNLKQRLRLLLERLHLRGFERRLIERSEQVFDISLYDMRWWKKRLPSARMAWLPPMAACEEELKEGVPPAAAAFDFDFAFVGNLHTRNNIAALKWLLEKVMPPVWRQRPGARLVIAGSHPTEEVRELAARFEQVTLLPNPPDGGAVYANASVLVNPAQAGSGINLKTVDMFGSGRPCVVTSQAVAGFHEEIRSILAVHDAPEDFARAMLAYLSHPDRYPLREVRAHRRKYFCDEPEAVLSAWLAGNG